MAIILEKMNSPDIEAHFVTHIHTLANNPISTLFAGEHGKNGLLSPAKSHSCFASKCEYMITTFKLLDHDNLNKAYFIMNNRELTCSIPDCHQVHHRFFSELLQSQWRVAAVALEKQQLLFKLKTKVALKSESP
jgi:hypothetical protein